MQRINEAWAVLGDPERRAAYDRGLEVEERTPAAARAPRTTASRPSTTTTPTTPPLLDDTPVEGTQVSRWLQTLPAALLLGGVAAVVVGAR